MVTSGTASGKAPICGALFPLTRVAIGCHVSAPVPLCRRGGWRDRRCLCFACCWLSFALHCWRRATTRRPLCKRSSHPTECADLSSTPSWSAACSTANSNAGPPVAISCSARARAREAPRPQGASPEPAPGGIMPGPDGGQVPQSAPVDPSQCQGGMVGTPPNCKCPESSELLGGNCVHYTASSCTKELTADAQPQACAEHRGEGLLQAARGRTEGLLLRDLRQILVGTGEAVPLQAPSPLRRSG